MQLPSLHRLLTEAARVVRRFPLTLLCALVLGGVGIYWQRLDYHDKDQLTWLFPVLSTAGLGLTLTLSAALAGERYGWPAWGRLLSQAGAVALLGLWYATCPTDPSMVWGLRLVLLLLALHLLVAVVPYLPALRRGADTPGFWRYNETLFLRILTAALYSGVLYAGGALALLAIENLFDVKLYYHVYEHLFTVLATGFNTWFFLAGVPRDFAALETDAPYPKGLKVFTQFVLLPLVVLYLGILYAYMGRILAQWELPKGWVSVLVLAFSVAGIFALLLIHPIRDAAENTWVRTFARWFYRALFPLLALLAVAIGTRVRSYGITEERYFVLILAAWLAVMATYFLLRQGRGIIWIPASLALVALLAAGGPWGAFAVAERSQLSQLRDLAAQYKLLRNSQLDGAGRRVPALPLPVQRRISSIFEFFTHRGAEVRLQPLFAASLTLPDSLREQSLWQRREYQLNQLLTASGIDQGKLSTSRETELQAAFDVKFSKFRDLGAGRYWVNDINLYNYRDPQDEVLTTDTLRQGIFRLRSTRLGRHLWLEQQRPDGRWQRHLRLSPGVAADSLARRHGRNPPQSVTVPTDKLTLQAAAGPVRVRLFLTRLSRFQQPDTVFYNFEGQALLELGEE